MGQGVVLPADLLPPAGQQLAHDVEGLADTEQGGRIAGPGPVELEPEARPVGPGRVGPVADDQRADAGLPVPPDVEEAGSLRSAEPLVTVAGVVRRPERPEVDRHHARRVCSVDDHVDATGLEGGDHGLHREHHAGGTGDVVQEHEPRPRGHCAEHRVRDVLRAAEREGHAGDHHAGAGPARDRVECVDAGVVAMVGGEQLVARVELERAEHGVHPGGGVVHEGQVVRIGAEEGGEAGPCIVEQRLERPDQEVDGVPLHPGPELGLQREHLPRAGPERSVVEEGDLGVERPVRGQRRGVRPLHRGAPVRSGRSKVRCVSSNPRLR
jgi:hypothetical protein